MDAFQEFGRNMTRRHFFSLGSHAVGWAALTSLLSAESAGAGHQSHEAAQGPHFPAKAKQVIYLHMVGGPP